MKLGPTTFQCTCLSVRCRSLYVLSCFCRRSATLLPSVSDMPGMVKEVMRPAYPPPAGGIRGLDRTKLRDRLTGRPPRRIRGSADLQQPDRAVTMRAQRLEQLEHRPVVDRVADKPPADHLRQVEVADRDRFGVAERALGGL